MRISPSSAVRAGLAVLTVAVAAAGPLQGQETRDVVSKEIVVGQSEALLRLGISGGGSLAIALVDGEVTVNDDVVGSYVSGDALDLLWRDLLGTAVSLEDGPLARTLVAWSPTGGLADGVGGAIDRALESALSQPEATETADAPSTLTLETPAGLGALSSILSRVEQLQGLSEALEDVDLDEMRLAVGEDLRVGPGIDLDATVLVVDADLEVEGTIRGDVVVVGGDVLLLPGGRIEGDLRYADGRVLNRGGSVLGEVIGVESRDAALEREIQDRVRTEVERATRRASSESYRGRGWGVMGCAAGGFGAALGNLFTVLALGLLGGAALYFAGSNVDAVAETARRTPGRAALVGLAGSFLLLPAYILGIIALAISIIGIPALILWAPLFPIAVVIAGGLGYVAVARNIGSWIARQDYPYMDWVRVTNPYSLVFGGALALMSPFIASNIVSVVPVLGILQGFLETVGVMACLVVSLVGFGSVLLTRAGRRPEFWEEDLFADTVVEDWEEEFAAEEPATAESATEEPDAEEKSSDE